MQNFVFEITFTNKNCERKAENEAKNSLGDELPTQK